MMKQLMIGTAAAALMLSAASAQSPSAPAGSGSPSPAAQSAPAPATGSMEMVASQKPDQFMASSFKGTDVLGADDKKIGDVSDILFNKDGRIDAYVVSVGGFLGVGAKEVAMAPDAFQVVPGDKSKGEADKLKITMTQDELKQAQNFTRYEPPRATTTGAGAGASGMRPSTNTPPSNR
jgi:sporulation protein YlmC with PRC-barrel domain